VVLLRCALPTETIPFRVDADTAGNHSLVMTAKHSSILAMMAILALGLPLFGQEVHDLGELLSGKTHPLTVKLKDLDARWRRFTVRGSANVTGNMSVNVNGYTNSSSANNSSSASHSQNNIVGALPSSQGYVTKGVRARFQATPERMKFRLLDTSSMHRYFSGTRCTE
jgi:hypothetical protein